jgi:hypothetical protein
VTGAALLRTLATGGAARPPWIPLLGEAAAGLAQMDEKTFTTDPQAHAMAVAQAAEALSADVVTAGLGADPAVGGEAVRRLHRLLAGRGVAGCLPAADVAGARTYCEAGAGMVLPTVRRRAASAPWPTPAPSTRRWPSWWTPISRTPPASPPASVCTAR